MKTTFLISQVSRFRLNKPFQVYLSSLPFKYTFQVYLSSLPFKFTFQPFEFTFQIYFLNMPLNGYLANSYSSRIISEDIQYFRNSIFAIVSFFN